MSVNLCLRDNSIPLSELARYRAIFSKMTEYFLTIPDIFIVEVELNQCNSMLFIHGVIGNIDKVESEKVLI